MGPMWPTEAALEAAATAAEAVELLPRLFAAAAAAAVAGCVGASSWLSPLLPLPELSIRKGLRSKRKTFPCNKTALNVRATTEYEYEYLTSSAKFAASISTLRSASGSQGCCCCCCCHHHCSTTNPRKPSNHLNAALRLDRNRWPNSEASSCCDPTEPSPDTSGPSIGTRSSASSN